jgi:hypothetical protein
LLSERLTRYAAMLPAVSAIKRTTMRAVYMRIYDLTHAATLGCMR